MRAIHRADNALFVILLLLLLSQDHNLQRHRHEMIISTSYVRTAAVPPRTVHGDGHVWLALVLESERQPCAKWDLSTHNAVAAIEVGCAVVPACTLQFSQTDDALLALNARTVSVLVSCH
jgi:hypothetical protein